MENGFLEMIQDAVLYAGKEVKDAAEDITQRAKLRYEIRTREGYLNELYIELGKLYFSMHKDDDIPSKELPLEDKSSEVVDIEEDKEAAGKEDTEFAKEEKESFAEEATVREVKDLLEELSALRGELDALRKASCCPKCGAKVPMESDYCGKCGAYLKEE